MEYATREEWLQAFIDAARPKFEEVNAPLPYNVRVAVGFTSKGARGKTIGECWSSICSQDGHFEIFLKPTLDGAARIADVLTHELIHAAVGLKAGHGQAFKRVAVALGLGGKMTATIAMQGWYEWALPVLDRLGPIPYGTLNGAENSGRKKQKTALLKVECDTCGWLARVTAKHIDPYDELACPTGCGGILREG
jgi:hypothetical protein